MKKIEKTALLLVTVLTLVNCATDMTIVQDTSSPSLQTPLLGGAEVGSLYPSLEKDNFSDLEKEYESFKTKALSDTYVKRMFGKYLAPVNSVQLTRQLEFSRYLKLQSDTSYETSLKNMFSETPALYGTLTGISAIQTKMTSESATFGAFVLGLSPYNYTSCKALRNSGVLINGVYSINQDNNISTPSINVYCDMTTDGGGWTLVAAQYETDYSTSWNEGIQANYDPSLATKKAFALSSSQLPLDKTQTAFGLDLNPTGIDYVDFVYSTGNITLTRLTGKKPSGYTYDLHRNDSHYYGRHDPELPPTASITEWNNTTTFDRTGGSMFSWAFCLQQTNSVARGYSYNGYDLQGSVQTAAWTIWVR